MYAYSLVRAVRMDATATGRRLEGDCIFAAYRTATPLQPACPLSTASATLTLPSLPYTRPAHCI